MSPTASPFAFDVAVIGAGLSGLVTAFTLQQRGVRVAVVEAAARAGGVIGTRRREGYLYETGPNSTQDSTPLLSRLLEDLGIGGQRVDTAATASKRYVVRHGKLVALPSSPAGLLSNSAFSIAGKLRLAWEPFVARAKPEAEESIAAFARRRLGPELLDYAVDPFVSGIHAGDPDRISVAAAFPRLHALEQRHGSLLRSQLEAARAARKRGESANRSRISFGFRNGMQTLTDALVAQLEHYTDQTAVATIERAAGGFEVHGLRGGARNMFRARAVVVATPACAAVSLLAPLAPEAAAPLATIESAPVAIAACAYRREDVEHPLDGFGFLVPARERRRILGTLFSSSLFEGRAPAGHVLLTTFVGGRRNPTALSLDDEALGGIVTAELSALAGAESPRWVEIVRWPRAIPQYELGHLARVQAVADATSALAGLHLCGSWHGGVSVGDRVERAHEVAERVLAFLAR